jgi:hypothetical protein
LSDGEQNKELATRIDVQNLVVNPRQKREIAIGDTDSFARVAKDTVGISAILWNEGYIALLTKDPSTIISFRPEINESISMFFTRAERRSERDLFGREVGSRVWEGDYEPVRFSKGNLLKFLKQYSQGDSDSKLIESVKEMKITERHSRTEKMISLDDENFQATEEQIMQTNIPTKFNLELPIIETASEKVSVKLEFEAQVVTNKDRFSEEHGKKLIELRCVNARKVLHDLMKGYTNLLPNNIPRYYGRLSIQALEGR